jgi:hypothetical protein
MKLELKNIKFSERMSEETNCFDAFLYINGVKALYVRNDGRGGSTDYQLTDLKHKDLVKQTEDFCLGLPPIQYSTFEIKMNLEHKIDELFESWLKEKDKEKLDKKLLKDMEKGICYKQQNGYMIITWKGHTINSLLRVEQGRTAIKNKINQLRSEGKEILNTNIPANVYE